MLPAAQHALGFAACNQRDARMTMNAFFNANDREWPANYP